MSSILDALKKLDQEKDEPARDIDWPQPIDTRSALRSRLNGRFPYKPLLAGLIVVLLLAGAGRFVLNRPPVTGHRDQIVTTPPPAPVPDIDSPIIAAAPEQALPRPRLPRPADASRAVPTIDPPEPPEQPLKSEHQEPALAEPVSPLPDAPVATAVIDPPAPTPDETLDPDMADLLTRVPQDLLPPRKLVESGWLTLQAISWSETPERRIAVINAQLVKEGRRISGALIRRIDRDYVVIEKDGEQLMLPFGNH